MNEVKHGGPSTKEGEGVLAGQEEGSDELNEILRRTRGPGLCSPEDFEYKRQRIEEEEEQNTAPRRTPQNVPSMKGGEKLFEDNKEGEDDMNEAKHRGPSTKEGEEVLTGQEE